MEHVIRKLFGGRTLVARTQRVGLSQEEVIALRFGPCLKHSPTKHDNVDSASAPHTDDPPPSKDKIVGKTADTPAPTG